MFLVFFIFDIYFEWFCFWIFLGFGLGREGVVLIWGSSEMKIVFKSVEEEFFVVIVVWFFFWR